MSWGGQPPTFEDIYEDLDSLWKFTDIIFEDDTERRWHPKVRELLVMTLLLRYDQFLDILQAHPFAKLVESHPDADDPEDRYSCSAVENNIFVNRVNQMLEKARDGDLMFPRWRTDAKKAFVHRNGPGGLPIQIWSSYGVEPTGGILMDTRTLIDHFNLLASIAQSNHMELQRQRHILNDLQQAFNVESKITSCFIVERLFNMERSLKRLEENLLPEAPKPKSPLKRALMFSVSSKCLSTSASLAEVTTAFFVDDYRTGYDLESKSPAWNELDPPARKKLRNKYSLIKRAVRLVLMHADSFPLVSNNRAQHKKDVSAMTRAAEERIRIVLRFDPKSTITRSKLEKQPGLKELEGSLKLPDNTPGDWHKFFKTD